MDDIHFALLRSGVLAAWRSDVETASGNTISPAPLGKDYDAVIDVWNDSLLARFALEYERTLKSKGQYEKICHVLKTDTRVGCVLYLGSGSEVVVHLVREFSGISSCRIPKQQLIFSAVKSDMTFRNRAITRVGHLHARYE